MKWTVAFVSAAALGFAAIHLAAQAPSSSAAGIDALFKDLKWRNIGPANMAGRVTDIEAVEANPAIVYVAAASGGVWKSVNAGTTWEPIFTNYRTSSIGDIGIYQKDPNIIWVGTGEGCVRNSAEWGDGIYKSTDAGKTFVNVGLNESHHIARVVTHPTNPDIVYVAAQGHLWGYNPERGVFKTTDGGKTWKKLANGLPNDNKTGAGDLIMDPANPNILYANMWERIRKPYVFESGGPNSGLYKSTNGGDSWTKLGGGLPTGSVGKIGLTIFRRNSKILTAIVEAPRSADAGTPGPGIYRSEDAGATWTFMNASADRPFYYNHIYLDPNVATRLYVLQVPARVSEDGGKTFPRSLPGIEGDFHAMWIDPSNSDRFYIANDKGASVTYDGGRNFIMFDNMDIGQFYAVTADNRDPYYLYGGLQDSGNWGGPSNSRDYNGILGDHWFKFHSGDGFHTTVDPEDWRIVYTETQNGGIRRLDSTFRQQGSSVSPRPATIMNYADVTAAEGKAPQFRYNWSSPLILSPHDSKILYLGSNRVVRSTDRGETWEIISPDLSTNDPELTTGPAPAMGERGGAENHATIISVVESPVMAGLIWAGTDDGNVQVTRDGGKSWTNVRPNIPASVVPVRTWVSRVEPSHFDAGTAYVSFDGHRSDNMNSYILKTTDFGKTWTSLTSLTSAFPAKQPVYVVKEDLKNPRLLFAGTEYGVRASIDGGVTWRPLNSGGFPTVAVHDLVIHPREGDLIAATHGRSLWILDDITPLQQLTPEVLAADAYMFRNKVATIWQAVSRGATRGHLMFSGRNPLTIAARPPANSPTELANSATVTFYLKNAPAGPVTMEIATLDGSRTASITVPATAGINRYFWNMRFAAAGGGGGGRGGRGGGGGAGGGVAAGGDAADAPPPAAAGGAEPGTYRVKLTVDGKTMTTTLMVRAGSRDSAVKRALALGAALVVAGVVCLAQAAQQAPSVARQPLNVMTFNIRYGTANDGENRWANRRDFLFEVVKGANADVIGLQEALDAQLQEIVAAVPAFAVIGVGRDDGRTKGEYAAILFRKDRLHVSDSGTFWFSDTPSVVASTSWGNTITRICTWARFVDRDGRAFWHFNVHLDHISQPSREKSTALLAQRMTERRNLDEPAIVTGDFNVGEDNPAIATLLGPRAGAGPLMLDTFRVLYRDEKVVGTFNNFVAGQIDGPKIDYILVPPGTEVMAAEINRVNRDGRYASDHFPVTARIILKP